MEHNYRYNKYDYSYIIPKRKVFLRRELTNMEFQAFKNAFGCDATAVSMIVDRMKMEYAWKSSRNLSATNIYDFNPNDYNWEWEIITPTKTYSSNETSSKEK